MWWDGKGISSSPINNKKAFINAVADNVHIF